MEKQEIQLSDLDLKRKKIDSLKIELEILKSEGKMKRFEKWLESDYVSRSFKKGIEELSKTVESGKDEDGKEIDDITLEDLKIQLEIKKEELEKEIPKKELKVALEDLREKVENGKRNLKTLNKQIREKKMIITR